MDSDDEQAGLPPTTHGLWTDAATGQEWAYWLEWNWVGGRIEVTGMRIASRPRNTPEAEDAISDTSPGDWGQEAAPLTSTVLRHLPLGRLTENAKRMLVRYSEWMALHGPESELQERRDRLAEQAAAWQESADRGGSRQGRPREYGPDHWAAVSTVYDEAWRRGRPPRMAVAEWGTVAPSTAAKWIARCRDMGLLGPTEQGKAGGIEPTDDEQERGTL